MIRKLDWYLIKYFLFSLLVTTFILLGLFLVIDFFSKLKPFMETEQSVTSFIIEYYTYRLPIYLLDLLPIITLTAVMLTIIRFIKTNELIPMFSAGISARRIILPFFGIALILVLLMFLANEALIPSLEEKLSYLDKVLRFEGFERYLLIHDAEKNSILIERYDYTHKKMDNIKMIKFDANGEFQSIISAEYSHWQNMEKPGWTMYSGIEYLYDKHGGRQTKRFAQEGHYMETTLTPSDLERSEKSLAYMGINDITALINQYPHRTYLRMQLYNKFASPFSLLILLLIGIPFIMIGESHNLFMGIGICLLISLLFFFAQFFFGNLGTKDIVPPLLAVTFPLILFGLIGAFLLRKVQT